MYTSDDLLARTVPEDDCLLWTGGTSAGNDGKGNYGTLYINRKINYTHRLMYQLVHGDIPDNHLVKALCGKRLCINPEHLRAVTQSRKAKLSVRAVKTHCPQGHPYAGTNLYYDHKGVKRCRTCRRAQKAACTTRNK